MYISIYPVGYTGTEKYLPRKWNKTEPHQRFLIWWLDIEPHHLLTFDMDFILVAIRIFVFLKVIIFWKYRGKLLYFVRIHFDKSKKSYKINQWLWVYVRNTPLISLTPRFPPNWWYIFSLFSSCHKFHYLKGKNEESPISRQSYQQNVKKKFNLIYVHVYNLFRQSNSYEYLHF